MSSTWNDALEAAARKAEALAPVTHDFGDTLSAARYDEIAAAIRALKRPEAAADDTHAAGMREGRERERADVVAWLGRMHPQMTLSSDSLARRLLCGEHAGAAAESGGESDGE